MTTSDATSRPTADAVLDSQAIEPYQAELEPAIAHLRTLSQQDIQSAWHWIFQDVSIAKLERLPWQNEPIAPLNDRQHIAWSKGQQVVWLVQQVVVPEQVQRYPVAGLTLRFSVAWWAEVSEIYVNGQLVQAGDLFDYFTRIQLSAAVKPGQAFTLAIRLVSPGHDDGALVRSHLIYEVPNTLDLPTPEPGFVADELAVVREYLTHFQPDQLSDLTQIVRQIAWNVLPDRIAFHDSLAHIRQQLTRWQDWLKQRQINYLGHAHLDMAWLWPLSDTWDAAERTFTSALSLQKDFPDLIFGHSSPALYDWLEQNRPELFSQIQQQVQAGKWEIIAGLWVEPEFNTVSGESIVRQVLYGQQYTQEKFGVKSAIAWLPDSFGFCWQLPQILKQGGINYFVTQKLRWNDSTQFPHEIFQWQAPDGSQIFSFMSPPIGESIEPVKLAQYACRWEAQTQQPSAFWLPGIGDHGGGPTRDMLEITQRWQASPVFPELQSTSALAYLQQLEQSVRTAEPPLPVWNDELYLEFHRGCYTSHADLKWLNRRCEDWLYEAELYATVAYLLTDTPYPAPELEQAWKNVLFNQFHDILPGSAIPEVFVDANQMWKEAQTTALEIRDCSLATIAVQIDFSQPPAPDAVPVVVFNSCNWVRSHIIELTPPPEAPLDHWQVLDQNHQPLTTQPSHTSQTLLIQIPDVPSIGYRVIWLVRSQPIHPFTHLPIHPPTQYHLQNPFLRVTLDPTTGDIAQVFDQVNQRPVLGGNGNQLQAFQDQGQYWDAWNIDPDYQSHPLPPSQLISINWLEQGDLRQCIRVVRRIGQSDFQQDYILEADSPILKIATKVNWQERHVLVKVAFPLAIASDSATYEIPYGAITRPTQPTTPAEKAKWEVPALRWADLSTSTSNIPTPDTPPSNTPNHQPNYGVSLLNDCKYGYDSQPNCLRLTLLRGSEWPDPQADLGEHQFTYALYPHAKTWQTAQTVQRGYELNRPLLVWYPNLSSTTAMQSPTEPTTNLPTLNSFLSTSTPNNDNNSWILSAVKPAESNPKYIIIRGYESGGQLTEIEPKNRLNLTQVEAVNLLEEPNNYPSSTLSNQTTTIHPWKITSFRCQICDRTSTGCATHSSP
ncbi:MAG: alpha-mannosidase [Thainema sp.]